MNDWYAELLGSMTPAQRKAHRREMRRRYAINKLCRPLQRIPVIGDVIAAFWGALLIDGVVETLKPRWGAMTFGYLNDGIRPTLWHTWQQIVGNERYDGIWTDGAPRNRADAERKLAEYETKRWSEYHGE